MKIISTTIIKFVLLLCVLTVSCVLHAQNKYALIIGNSDYSVSSGNFKSLSTSINDANAMNIALQSLGFNTTVKTDASKTEILKAVNEFAKKIKNTDVAVFYYSGHAVTRNNEQYLVPCKELIDPESPNEYSVAVNTIRSKMKTNCRLTFLFLDACRNSVGRFNDFQSKGGDTSIPSDIGGGDGSKKPYGQKIFYATRDGEKAYTGSGKLSYFTKYLVNRLFDSREFRIVWDGIFTDVATNCRQEPVAEGGYEENFYFNRYSTVQRPTSLAFYYNDKTITPPVIDENKITKTFVLQPNNAKIFFGDESYSSGVKLTAKDGTSYKYKVEAEGYITKVGDIEFSANSESDVVISLRKVEKAKLRVECQNTKASVYLDDKYVGLTPITIETTTGYHDIRLTKRNYDSQTSKIDIDSEYKRFSTSLNRYWPDWFCWDDDGAHNISYHYSPEYQIGLSYLYRFEYSRWSIGAIVGTSTGLFRGWDLGTTISQSVSIGTSTTITINGESYQQTSQSISTQDKDSYSEEVDPFNEAKQYDANLLFLGNCGFNVCNGFMLEAGVGAGYHKGKYKMPHTYNIIKTITTNLTTGELLGEPKYQYQKIDGSKWYSGKSKWSPAFRLGAKFLIPIDGFSSYSSAITLGGGYTYLPNNNEFSSWDVNVGYTWFF